MSEQQSGDAELQANPSDHLNPREGIAEISQDPGYVVEDEVADEDELADQANEDEGREG